jgi:hypothetical protein
MTSSGDDLTIDELLRDPLTRALMRADRVDPSTLEAALRSVAQASLRPTTAPLADEGVPFDPSWAGAPLRRSSRHQDEVSRCLRLPRDISAQLCETP